MTDDLTPEALIEAASKGNTGLLTALLAEGLDVNVKVNNDTALTEAATDQPEAVRLLLDKGADIDQPGKGGNTALNMAVIGENAEIAKLLIERGADINIQNRLGKTPLIEAAFFGYAGIAALLLQQADVHIDETDKNGETALMLAVAGGKTEIVSLLLQAGADTAIKNQSGKTAMDIARLRNNTFIVDALEGKAAPAPATPGAERNISTSSNLQRLKQMAKKAPHPFRH